MPLSSNPVLGAIASTPPVTSVFTITLILFSSLYFYLRRDLLPPHDVDSALNFPYLVIVPGNVLYHPWTLVTAGFLEVSLIELVFALVTVPLSLRYLERLWGWIETIKFIVIVIGISNVIAVAVNWLEYLVLGNGFLWLQNMSYRGVEALQAGILVAFTQLMPEHQIQLFYLLKIRVKRLPMAYVTFSTVLCLIGFQSPFILIQFGWLVSWAYLRFYKSTGSEIGGTVIYGDRSETFAFVYWTPPPVHYPVTIISTIVHDLALRLHLIPAPPSNTDVELGGYSSLPGGARAEAERRRAMALKALDQRLASNKNARQPDSTSAGGSGEASTSTTLPPASQPGA